MCHCMAWQRGLTLFSLYVIPYQHVICVTFELGRGFTKREGIGGWVAAGVMSVV